MGFAIAVTSVPATGRDSFLANAGLSDSGEADKYSETLLSGATWNNQYLTWRNLRMTKRMASPRYDLISKGLSLHTLELHETSMGVEVGYFEDGRQVWSAGGSDHGYQTEGNPPLDEPALIDLCKARNMAVFGAEKAAKFAAEDEDFTDPFAMAIELFVAQTGFRYDADDVESFTALKGEMPYPKPWWKIW